VAVPPVVHEFPAVPLQDVREVVGGGLRCWRHHRRLASFAHYDAAQPPGSVLFGLRRGYSVGRSSVTGFGAKFSFALHDAPNVALLPPSGVLAIA